MKGLRQPKRLFQSFAWLLSLFAFVVIPLLAHQTATAGQLTQRSLLIASSVPSATTNHEFTFTFENTSSVGSLKFEYCTTPLFQEPCTTPTGLDVSSVALQGQGGETGFSVFSASANQVVLTRIAAPVTQMNSQYVFSHAINPSSTQTFFVRISSYVSSDASGSYIDAGTVSSSTTQTINISTEVPPILNFCVGVTIPGDCSTADGNFIQLGDLNPNFTAGGTSQMWVGTNALNGYIIDMLGTTMTSGNNIITALASPTQSAAGNSQFGVNLRANTVPRVGSDVAGPGTAQPTANYNTANKFMFKSGDTVVAAGNSSDWQRFTASYIVNVTAAQPAGVYNTTVTYICSAAF
ncbi:MAG TPA: hypothetical protein VJR27_01010 [Candidatus Saccharimonadales bacterium]|nr:hypothetical protein [Candidatus Saccharimonadales bacterium]